MDRRRAQRRVLALTFVALIAIGVSFVGGSRMEVQLVGAAIAVMLVAALVRARGMVSEWPETSGSGLPSRVTHPRSSSWRLPSGPNPKVG